MGPGLHHRPPSPIRVQKVRKILQKFDVNNDGYLNREEMSALVVAVNPKASFNEDQVNAILDEVFRTYGDYIEPDLGLCFDGLLQTYDDGAGDIDRDFKALGLELGKEVPISSKKLLEEGTKTRVNSPSKSIASRALHGSRPSSPRNGVIYDGTWSLIKEVEVLIRKLEVKKEKKAAKGGQGDLVTSDGDDDVTTMSPRWPIRDLSMRSFCGPICRLGDVRMVSLGRVQGLPTSGVRLPWNESGHDYAHFQKQLNELRKKADRSCTQDECFDAHMAIGRTLFDHKLCKEALLSFERARELKPTDVRPLFQEGNCCYALGKMLEAMESYTSALNLGEVDAARWSSLLPQVHVNLGIALEAEGMLLSACEHYKEAVIKEPKHYRALKLLGSALYGVGEYRAAKEALLDAIFLHSDYADAHCELGSVLHALGEHDEAISEFKKALELKSDHVEALYNLATLFKDIGQYQKASETYVKVLNLDPTNWRAQINKAVSLLGGGDIIEAKRAFKEAYRMTGRSEVYDAMVHLRRIGKRPKSVSNCLKPSDVDSGERSRVGNTFIEVDSSCFKRGNASTTSRELLTCALDVRHFQTCTRLNRCNIANLKRELNQSLMPTCNSRVSISEKLIRKEALEKVIKRLLHYLKPEAFQGAMKAINERLFAALDPSGSGKVDFGMTLAVLALVCNGSLDQRKHIAFDALVYRSSENMDGEISKEDARKYMKVLKACFHSSVGESYRDSSSIEDEDRQISLSFPEFIELLDDQDQGFQVLNVVEKLEMEVYGRVSCSVCGYPISGPRFKETNSNFILCSLCYSSGKVP